MSASASHSKGWPSSFSPDRWRHFKRLVAQFRGGFKFSLAMCPLAWARSPIHSRGSPKIIARPFPGQNPVRRASQVDDGPEQLRQHHRLGPRSARRLSCVSALSQSREWSEAGRDRRAALYQRDWRSGFKFRQRFFKPARPDIFFSLHLYRDAPRGGAHPRLILRQADRPALKSLCFCQVPTGRDLSGGFAVLGIGGDVGHFRFENSKHGFRRQISRASLLHLDIGHQNV